MNLKSIGRAKLDSNGCCEILSEDCYRQRGSYSSGTDPLNLWYADIMCLFHRGQERLNFVQLPNVSQQDKQ